MSQEIAYPSPEPLYFVAHNNGAICHWGKLMTVNVMTTGFPIVEEFSDVNLWIDRVAEFGITIDEEGDEGTSE